MRTVNHVTINPFLSLVLVAHDGFLSHGYAKVTRVSGILEYVLKVENDKLFELLAAQK